MAKTSGGVRMNQSASTKVLSTGIKGGNIQDVQRQYANDYVEQMGNRKQSDVYRDWDDDHLKKFIKLGESYNDNMREKAIRVYTEKATAFSRKTGRNENHIEHAELSGVRHELTRVGHAYAAYKNMQLYKDELKRRKKK